jgi:hypothetical protein
VSICLIFSPDEVKAFENCFLVFSFVKRLKKLLQGIKTETVEKNLEQWLE